MKRASEECKVIDKPVSYIALEKTCLSHPQKV